MLTSLRIQNVALIDKLDIEFRSGLCALTGETGAGKSILLDALGLALGARSESSLVRKGADQAQVTAEFQVEKNHSVLPILRAAELEADASLILRRSVTPDGRSRAFINDQPVSAGLLRQAGESLLEIHGQFETQGLLNVAAHRRILDEYAGLDSKLPALWAAWKDAEKELARLTAEAGKSRMEENFLRQSLEDLDALAPQPGEEKTLSAARTRLMSREKILEALAAAHDFLTREDDPVRAAWRALDRVAASMDEQGAAVIAALSRAAAEMQEADSLIQSLSADLEEGGQSLETIDDRLHELRAQARKHNCDVDALADMRNALAEKLNLIERGDDVLAAQVKAVEKTRKAYEIESAKISEARLKAAKKLDALVAKELPPLKMERAKFLTEIQGLPEPDWGPEGKDRVRFLVATNRGAASGPINKIASGGEMARFMLALKVVMAESMSEGGAQSLIFDEVDSGIGGAVASAVGERLSRLAKTRQVLVVTHAPQVAARADHHYVVSKSGARDVKTNVSYLESDAARREEIARMLSGASITREARAAAEKLLETGT